LVSSAEKYPGDVAIIAIGPLTNLALAYHSSYSFAEKVGFISLMGGSISGFGIRQFFAAEFNFFLDAEAAHIVFEVFPKICVNSFDLSFDLGTKKTLSLFVDESTPKGKLIHDIHSVILQTHRPSVCDPLACIAVFSPEVIESVY
jgi:inosine-uridine nucleoside N-ribohydrolase